MRKQVVIWLAGLVMAACLYFFENNTGTRMVLVCFLLLPALPQIRRSLFTPDEVRTAPAAGKLTLRSFIRREADEPGDVRKYQPGDPVNRIHWKLSAKKDELLVREWNGSGTDQEEEEKAVIREGNARSGSLKRKMIPVCLSFLLTAMILLLLIPDARDGAKALANHVFDASEAVNAYVYSHFPVSGETPVIPAVLLLTVMLSMALCIAALSGSRILMAGLAAGCVLFQIYFGLSFPVWANLVLFMLFVLGMLRRPRGKKSILPLLTGILVLSLATGLLWPGVDLPTEEASEHVRDLLSEMAGQHTGMIREMPAGENETRHVQTRSLMTGEGEARTEKEYRLTTVEEEQISMPHWIDYLKIALLLLLTAAVLIMPFIPFLALNARRKKALKHRAAFQSENVCEALCAIFQQVISWLEATGHGAGNLPYIQWKESASLSMPPDYTGRFADCAELFEEAAYSAHPMGEEQRRKMLELLKETEAICMAAADWKQKIYLKYGACLWV